MQDPTHAHTLKDDFECIICLDKPRTHFSNACAHMVLCGTCAATQTACPFCRTETTFRQLFVV